MRSFTASVGIGVVVGVSLLGVSAASADVVFNFEEQAGNEDNTSGDLVALNLASDGVYAVITRTEGERFTVWDSQGVDVPGSWGSKHLSPVFNLFEDDYLVMSFSEGMSRVTVEFGDYGQDHDLAEVWAYDTIHAEGTLLGFSTGELGENDMRWDAPTSVTFVAQPGEAIWSIKFRGGQDPFYQSTFIDNISMDVVPTPGTVGVFGLAWAIGARRRRR